MSLFPAFLKLHSRRVLVVGGGSIAAQKIPGLLEAGAHVHVVSPKLAPQLAEWVRNRQIDWSPKPFAPDDLDGAFLYDLGDLERAALAGHSEICARCRTGSSRVAYRPYPVLFKSIAGAARPRNSRWRPT